MTAIVTGAVVSYRSNQWECLAQGGAGSDGYAYRAFGRWAWLARLRAWAGMWRHHRGWPDPSRHGLLQRVLAGRRVVI